MVFPVLFLALPPVAVAEASKTAEPGRPGQAVQSAERIRH